MPIPSSATAFLAGQVERVRRLKSRPRIVFPEGQDARILGAAEQLAREELLEPILLGRAPARAPAGVRFLDPATAPQTRKYAEMYHERRRNRGVTERMALEIASRPLYFAALMVAAGEADGSVGGAANSTAETVRAALHSIGMAPAVRTVSSFFVLAMPRREFGHHGLLVAADCAVVVSPTAAELADIAIAAAGSARTLLDTEPVVALLAPAVETGCAVRLAEAQRILTQRAPGIRVLGVTTPEEMDGANTIVFPNLNAGNIGYKLMERLAGGAAFGPLLQGLAKPANDLSRACSAEDVYGVAIITALQAGAASAT